MAGGIGFCLSDQDAGYGRIPLRTDGHALPASDATRTILTVTMCDFSSS